MARRIVTEVWVSTAYDPKNPPLPVPVSTELKALWDTGATNSLITAKTAAEMKLAPTGSIEVRHAGGKEYRNTYLVNILLPNRVGFAGVPVAECAETEDDFGAVIGTDLITRGDFTLTNAEGKTCMSFRSPSTRRIDYVAEAKEPQVPVRRDEPKIGRNQDCHAGRARNTRGAAA
jgi:hypothetical protein